MEKNKFVKICNRNFGYLIDEFGFKNIVVNDDGIAVSVIYERSDIKLKIVNHVLEYPEFPIAIYFIAEEKRFFNRFFKKVRTYDLEDLLSYRKCTSQVYEYIDYCNRDTFYELIPEEKLEYYKDKYCRDEEIEIILEKYSRLLVDFASDILKGNFDILPSLRKIREEYDDKYRCGSTYN